VPRLAGCWREGRSRDGKGIGSVRRDGARGALLARCLEQARLRCMRPLGFGQANEVWKHTASFVEEWESQGTGEWGRDW